MEEKFVAFVVENLGTYIIQATEIQRKALLEKSILNHGFNIVASGEAVTVQEAAENAINGQLDLCNSADERLGLWYHYLPTEVLQERIRVFRRLDLRRVSDDEIIKELEAIIPIHYVMVLDYYSGTTLYRARKCDLTKPLYKNASDLSYPPTKYLDDNGNLRKISMGRLNEEGESLLYTTMNVNTLPAELRLEVGDSLYMVAYKVKKDEVLSLATIGIDEEDYDNLHQSDHDKSSWTREAIINHGILTDFLKNEFTKDVGKRTEFLYRATVLIAKKYFDPPNSHGYLYPSVAHKSGYNVAIKAVDVDRALEFAWLRILTYHGIDEKDHSPRFRLEAPFSNSIINGEIQYMIDPNPMDPNRTSL